MGPAQAVLLVLLGTNAMLSAVEEGSATMGVVCVSALLVFLAVLANKCTSKCLRGAGVVVTVDTVYTTFDFTHSSITCFTYRSYICTVAYYWGFVFRHYIFVLRLQQ